MSFARTSLNFSNAKNVLQEGLQVIARGEHECDLENLAQADSASIAVLLAWQRAALQNHSHLHFINTPENLVSLASVYGVNDLLALS
jgi:phospholipid transport system transporter-binding protein